MNDAHLQYGAWGEERACRYLTQLNYRLLTKNWRFRHLEIDIIAEHYGEIIFVEVKTRHQESFFTALGAVDEHKKLLLSAAARAYLHHFAPDAPFRFDIITVVGTPENYQLQHYKDAYRMRPPRRFIPH